MTTASIRSRFFDLAQLSEKPVVQKEKSTPEPSLPLQKLADNWITQFNHAIQSKNAEATEKLFQPEGIAVSLLVTKCSLVARHSGNIVGFPLVSVRQGYRRDHNRKEFRGRHN